MKRLYFAAPLMLAFVLLSGSSGCTWFANTFGGSADQATKTTIVEVFADACNTYATALRTAAKALDAKLLTDPQIASVDQAKGIGDGICKGPQPTNLTAAVVSVLSATASITLASGGH